jgi:putative ABC transport system permease protein
MSVMQDLRIALRLFRRAPLAAGIALSSIMLTVGATAIVFTAVKAVLIDPLPYARPAELVQIGSIFPKMQQQSHDAWVVWNDAQELIRRTRTLESVGVYRNAVFDLAGAPGATPEALYGLMATADLFPTLGVSPMIGRNILPEEDQPGHPDVMILSYGLWVRRFNSDRNVVGRTVTVNGHDCLVIGVMPPQFNFPMRRAAAHTPSPYVEFWSQMSAHPGARSGALGTVARLRPGVSLNQARQDVASLGDALAREFPATDRDRVLRLNPLREQVVGTARNGLLSLLAAAGLFMLIGCANVANLLLARGVARQREVAVRLAIGASPARIVRQLLTESCLLAVLGGLAGYLLTAALWKILPAVSPVSIPRLAAARADQTVLAFALVVAVCNGILFGVAPALRLAGGVRIGARHDATRSALVVAEVALSVLLVVVGGQLLGSFLKLMATDPGFAADHVVASVVLPSPERYPDPARRGQFYRRILDAVRALPGVQSAGTVDALPFSGENHGGWVGNADKRSILVAEIDVVGGDYLRALGIRLLKGRWFREEEMGASNDSAIVSDSVASRLWPGGNAIGQRVCVDCTAAAPNNWKRVIGVVTSAHHGALDEPGKHNVYLSAGAMQSSYFVVARTERPSAGLDRAIRRAIASIDPNQPVFLSATMATLIADSLADRRFIVMLLTATAALALLMAAAGVYGVISYATSRRTREFGIRMAVGAAPADVHALVFRQSFTVVLIGLAIGLMAALAAIRLLRGSLAGLESSSPVLVSTAVVLVALTAAIACWVPARRATLIDPVSALRDE